MKNINSFVDNSSYYAFRNNKRFNKKLLKMARALRKERAHRLQAQQKAIHLQNIIKSNQNHINFGKSISICPDTITIGQYAKLLQNKNIDIGRNNLYKWFRENGYLIKCGQERNLPKQCYMNQGLFKINERVINTSHGEVISTTTHLTGKGQMYFEKMLINKEIN